MAAPTNTITRTTINAADATVLQTWLNRTTLENLEPNLFFYKMGKVAPAPKGYNTVRWARFSKLTASIADMTLVEGETPTAVAMTASSVYATPVQYGDQCTISDIAAENNVIDFVKGAVTNLSANLARVIDKVIQAALISGATHKFYGPANAQTVDNIAASNTITAAALGYIYAYLENHSAPKYDGKNYICITDAYNAYALRSETGTGNWLEVNKYVDNKGILNGEIGTLNGFRIIVSPNIDTVAMGVSSAVSGHPAFCFGKDAYGVTDWQNVKTYITGAGATKDDPLDQRRYVAVKCAFATTVLEPDSLVVNYFGSAATL